MDPRLHTTSPRVTLTKYSSFSREEDGVGRAILHPHQKAVTNVAKQTSVEGIFSDQTQNYFRGWTRLFFKYCTGSGHQGSRSQPILYRGSQIYFRGEDVALAQFASANEKLGIFTGKVKQLVLTGESAGGLAALQWANYVNEKASGETEVRVIPDSGVFVDSVNKLTGTHSYANMFQNLMKLSNEQRATPVTACNAIHKDELWKCMLAEHLVDLIVPPLFLAQSLYDSWSLYYILGIRCMNEASLGQCPQADRKIIEEYRKSTLEVLFRAAARNNNGVWAPICVQHCFFSNLYYANNVFRVPQGSDYSAMRAVRDWMEGQDTNPRHIDFGEWPLNRPCSGLSH